MTDQNSARTAAPGTGRSCTMLLLYGLVLLSLALHAITLVAALQIRARVKEQISALADQLADTELQTITTSIRVKQDVPINATFPIQKSVVVPVNTTVNIDQVVSVPIETPFGTANINVPLKVSVPVNTTVPIAISDTISINTTVPLDLNVPVSIPLSATPFADLLRNIRKQLRDLNTQW